VSSLWTPDGERPVGPGAGGGTAGGSAASPDNGPDNGPDHGPIGGEEPDEAALADEMAAMRADLVSAPVDVVVANHCYGLFELAAVYLSEQPPLLPQACLAIDALAALIGGLEGRLGSAEEQLRDGLNQLRLAYVQIDGARRAGEQAASTAGVNGGSGGGPAPAGPADTTIDG